MSIPRFFMYIMVIFLSGQALALWVCWRRLKGRPAWQWLVTAGFILANLPWFLFANTFTASELPESWLIAYIIRPFTTWQVGTWLWLIAATVIGILAGLFYKLPQQILAGRRRALAESAGLQTGSLQGQDGFIDFSDVPAGDAHMVSTPIVSPSITDLVSRKPEIPTRNLSIGTSRRQFLTKAARGAAWAGIVAAGGWGLLKTLGPPEVVRYDVAFADLPKELNGLTIAHLSDLHVGGWTTADEIAQALDLTRSLKPDLVVMTGDLIDRNPAFSQALVRHLPLLAASPLGVWAVIGNHDVYTGASQVTAALNGHGLTMLRNQHRVFSAEGLPLAIIGVDDSGRHWTGSGGHLGIKSAAAGLPQEVFTILLAHRPTSFNEARVLGIPLTLCGHTHGGQFAIPGGPNLAEIVYEYTHGLYQAPGGLIHVSAGLGSVGLPFRIGVPAEVALLKLTAKA